MRPRRVALVVLAAVLALAVLAPPAGAHASRLTCSPEPGARLDEAPSQVVVVLSEAIEADATTMTVTDQDGTRVDRDDLQVSGGDNPRLTASLRPDLPDGAYTISWDVLSKDTHHIRESCGFAVGAFEPPASAQSSGSVPPEAMAARTLAFAGLALAFGALGLLVLRPGAPATLASTLTRGLAIGGGLHTVGLVLLIHYTVRANGLGLQEFMAIGVGANMALRLVLGLAALVVAALAVARPNRLAVPVAGATMVAAGMATSAYSHSFADGVGAIAVDFLHLAAAATWVGALVLFLVVLGRGARGLTPDEARRFGTRFGTLGLACVLLLFLAGTAVTLVLAGTGLALRPWDLLGSPWGRFVAAKVGLALLMVGLATLNRFVLLSPPAVRGLAGSVQKAARRLGPAFQPLPAGGTSGLRRLVAAEATVGLLVLLLAGALTSISPPTQAATIDSIELHGAGASFEVVAVLAPAPVVGGTSEMALYVRDLATGEAVASNSCDASGTRDTCVDVLVGAGNGTATQRHAARIDATTGAWTVPGLLWTVAGPATATVRIQTADVFQDTVALSFTVG